MEAKSLVYSLTCGGAVLMLGLTAFVLGLLLVETFKARNAARRLAEMPDSGVVSLAAESRGSHLWYGGVHDGRAYGLRAMGVATGKPSDQRQWHIFLRVAMALEVPRPLGITVTRFTTQKKKPADFDAAFQHDGADALSEEARAAMLDFVREGYTRRRKRDRLLSWGTGTRDLRLLDRADESSGIMAPDVLPEAATILVHHHHIANLTPEMLRLLLDDMADVAQAIEAGATIR